MGSDMLARLLKSPCTARWKDIGRAWADARTGELLLRLPSITQLYLRYDLDTKRVDFLPQLQHLTVLRLRCPCIPADALLDSLTRCDYLTELNLNCGFTSAYWSALLAKLTRIQKLRICGGKLDKLQCFASGPITESLEDLSISGGNLRPLEVSHLSSLRRLRSLRLVRCFSSPLKAAAVDSITPPSVLLPALTALSYHCQADDGGWVSLERQGPSYEWMQQRQLH